MESSHTSTDPFFIGWDVGGWNCDINANSRDAIVILDAQLRLVGTPWRGNLRESINTATSAQAWIGLLFDLCQFRSPVIPRAVMAIDTPLGFPDAFRRLVNELRQIPAIGNSSENPYLYRQTEQFLFKRGWKPMSPIKDMIGSQATKGMHVLSKFAPQVLSCGVWSDKEHLIAIEGYPTVARKSSTVLNLRGDIGQMPNPDCEDALMCALLAYMFHTSPHNLENPGPEVPKAEGWIWIPKE